MTEELREGKTIPEQEKPIITIARREYGYAGIYGIITTKTGKIVFVDDIQSIPITPDTRVIENPPVENALSSPIKVFFDPSLACPLRCPFCLAGVSIAKENRQRISSLSEKEIDKINQQIIEAGVLQVKIGGGEPFIYPHFWRILEQLGEAGIILSTSTSGVTLTNPKFLPKEKIEILRRSGVKISISVDGEPFYHDQLRGKEGLLESALEGRLRLLEHGVDPEKVEFRATIMNTPESMGQLDYLNNLSYELNTRIRIRLALPSGSAAINGVAVVYPTMQFWSFYQKLRNYTERNPLLNVEEIVRFDKEPSLKTGLDCGAGTRSAFIDSHGNFMPCGFIDEYLPVPSHNLFTEGKSLLELWQNGEAFIKVRSYLKQEQERNPCAQCGFVHSCQGGCPSVRLTTKTISDPRCPKEKRVYLPIEIRGEDKDRRIIFTNLTTGSLLLYQPNTQKPYESYIVFTGEIEENDGTLTIILKTPGGKMNGGVDKTLSDTARREIKEEIGINPADLYPIPVEETLQIINGERAKLIQTISLSALKDYLNDQEIPLAVIIDDKNSSSTLIAVYGYTTRIKPIPTSESPFVILIPKNNLAALTQVKTLEDLSKIGEVVLSGLHSEIDSSLPVLAVGTARQLIDKKIYVD